MHHNTFRQLTNNFADELQQYIQSTGEYGQKHQTLARFLERQRRLQSANLGGDLHGRFFNPKNGKGQKKMQAAAAATIEVNSGAHDRKYLKKKFSYR